MGTDFEYKPTAAWLGTDGLTPIERLADTEGLTRAFKRGVRDAIRRHKLLGEAIVVADENGMPKILEAHEYEIPPDPDAEESSDMSVAEGEEDYRTRET